MSKSRDEMMEQEALSILKMGNIATINIIERYKDYLRENNLVFEGKGLSLEIDVDPVIKFTEEFEDWAFKNANLLKNDVQIILLIGEGERNGTSGNKRKASRTRRTGRRSPYRKGEGEGDSGRTEGTDGGAGNES